MVAAGLLAVALALAPGARAEPPPARAADAKAAPTIPFRKDEGAGAMLVDVGLGLAVALGAGLVVLYLLRRYLANAQQAPGRRLRVIETVRLGPKAALYLVEFDDRSLLIGQQGENLAVLAPPPAAPDAPTRADDAG
jgi:flagellar biogenesis protein FliO